MCQIGRLFNCVRCNEQVIICSDCDRGQLYCNSECSKLARQESQRTANTRYQQTTKGKHNHAERQRRYRQQQQNQKKVTYQGSPEDGPCDVLPIDPIKIKNVALGLNTGGLHCHFCQKLVSEFLRNRFLEPIKRYRQ